MQEIEVPIDIELSPEIDQPQDLGSAQVECGKFFGTIGDQPIAFTLRSLYESSKQEVPAQYALMSAYELWVIPHRIAIVRRGGNAEILAVGVEIEYRTHGETCAVQSLFPSYRFVERASLHMNVSVGAAGEIEPFPETTDKSMLGDLIGNFGGLRAHAKFDGGLKINFQTAVATPEIQAIGKGSSKCEWQFSHHKEALYGRDIEMWSILALPRRKTSLEYTIRFSLVARTFVFSTRRESARQTVTCELSRGQVN